MNNRKFYLSYVKIHGETWVGGSNISEENAYYNAVCAALVWYLNNGSRSFGRYVLCELY